MGYCVVTVSPLKQFPIASFGLANVSSLSDALAQIRSQFLRAANLRIEEVEGVDEHPNKNFEEIAGPIFEKYKKAGEEEVVRFQARWAEGKIQPALEAHLARQKRRQAHFESACRLEGCDNPHRLGTLYNGISRAEGHTSRRHEVPLFCGAHAWLRRSLTKEALDALRAKSANRVRLTD